MTRMISAIRLIRAKWVPFLSLDRTPAIVLPGHLQSFAVSRFMVSSLPWHPALTEDCASTFHQIRRGAACCW